MNMITRPPLFRPAALAGLALLLPFAATACGGSGREDPLSNATNGAQATMVVSSPGFTSGAPVPAEYTCQGANVSPPLAWGQTPAQIKTFALILDDPDAGRFTHWVVYDIPPSVTELPRDVPKDESLPNGAKQGRNDFGKTGYGGPCPPGGSEHTYRFRVYALDAPLGLAGGKSESEVAEAMRGHILAFGELTGRFRR